MDNQHKKIKGYRALSQEEVNAMNAVKAVKDKAEEVGFLIEELQANADLDQYWVDIAKKELQQGFMAAVRSIAQPKSF